MYLTPFQRAASDLAATATLDGNPNATLTIIVTKADKSGEFNVFVQLPDDLTDGAQGPFHKITVTVTDRKTAAAGGPTDVLVDTSTAPTELSVETVDDWNPNGPIPRQIVVSDDPDDPFQSVYVNAARWSGSEFVADPNPGEDSDETGNWRVIARGDNRWTYAINGHIKTYMHTLEPRSDLGPDTYEQVLADTSVVNQRAQDHEERYIDVLQGIWSAPFTVEGAPDQAKLDVEYQRRLDEAKTAVNPANRFEAADQLAVYQALGAAATDQQLLPGTVAQIQKKITDLQNYLNTLG